MNEFIPRQAPYAESPVPGIMISNFDLFSLLADGKFHSGEELGSKFSISRSAVWKKIKTLQKLGVDIHCVKGKGYRVGYPVELLDRGKILSLLDKDIMPLPGGLEIHTIIDSTNQYLLDHINDPAFHRCVALAEYQTAGRGRRGNRWVSPFAAGITMSIAWHFDVPPEPVAGISLGAGVAIMRLLQKLGIRNAGLKWPNDIYIAGRKLGGSLVEIQAESEGPFNTVIGIGINYSFPVIGNNIEQPWIDIAEILQPLPSRNLIVAGLISEMFRLFTWAEQNGFSDIIEEWRRHDCMQGKVAALLLPGRRLHGLVLGIDNAGALLMSVNDKTQKFSSGEISLKAVADVPA